MRSNSLRRAEILTAGGLLILSAYFMWKSTELPVGWVDDVGPGGGAFPFWVSAGMLVCSAMVMVRALSGTSEIGRSTRAFVSDGAGKSLVLVGGALLVMIAAIHVIGVYLSVPLYLLFYLRVMGKHSWRLTLPIVLLTPPAIFFFFEIALKIFLPKGLTEQLFYPLYGIFL